MQAPAAVPSSADAYGTRLAEQHDPHPLRRRLCRGRPPPRRDARHSRSRAVASRAGASSTRARRGAPRAVTAGTKGVASADPGDSFPVRPVLADIEIDDDDDDDDDDDEMIAGPDAIARLVEREAG